MSNNDFEEIPDYVFHEAVSDTLGGQGLEGGTGTKPYNFRCPICGDSKKNSNLKRGYVLHEAGRWTYVCLNECGYMSFISFLKKFHPDAHRKLCFNGLKGRKSQKKATDTRTDAEKSYKASDSYCFKKGELVNVYDTHPTAKIALDYCISRKIPESIYEKWFVCIRDTKFHDRNSDGSFILNDKGFPLGNEYGDRLIIPYYRYGGTWIQFDARALSDSAFLRYRNLEGAERQMYNIDWLDTSKPFYLLEGSINSCFIKNSVAFGGTKHLMQFLKQFPQIMQNVHNGVFIWDNDDAGKDEMIKTIKMGFKWFDWSGVKVNPEFKFKPDGSLRTLNDINDIVRFGNDFIVDADGFLQIDCLKKYIKESDGGILVTMMYGDREKMRKEKVKKIFDEMHKKRKPKEVNLLLG